MHFFKPAEIVFPGFFLEIPYQYYHWILCHHFIMLSVIVINPSIQKAGSLSVDMLTCRLTFVFNPTNPILTRTRMTETRYFLWNIELLLPVQSEQCPQLRLIMERKTGYKDMREWTSREELIVDRAMKVVIAKNTYLGMISSIGIIWDQLFHVSFVRCWYSHPKAMMFL